MDSKLEVNLVQQQVITQKVKQTFDIDLCKIVKLICEKAGFDIRALTEENKDDIVLEFETNYNDYLNETLGVEIDDLCYNDEGYDMMDNLEEFERLKETFVNYVYETIYFF